MRDTNRWNKFFRRYQKSHMKSYQKELLVDKWEQVDAERKKSKQMNIKNILDGSSGTKENNISADIDMAIDYMSFCLQPNLRPLEKRSKSTPSNTPSKRSLLNSWATEVIASVDSVLRRESDSQLY